jgi:hypothetical protein
VGRIPIFHTNQQSFMKKTLLTLVVLLTTALSANAFGDIRFGVTGGYNLTSASFDKTALTRTLEGKNGSGWFIGPKAYMDLFAGLGVEGALHYNQREYKIAAGNLEVTEKLKSVDIPLNLKLNLTVQKVGVYLATGPQFSYGLGSNKVNLSALIDNTVYKTNNLTTTWNFGAGVALGGHLDLGIGYNVALGEMGEKILNSVEIKTGQKVLPAYRLNTFNVQATYYF